jgi:hypothetical protein
MVNRDRRATNDAELTRIEDRPLSPHDLARIRDSLSEAKRWPFMLSLDERLFDQVVALTTRVDKPADNRRNL